MPAKVQLIGGNFQDSEGNVLSLGYLKMHLNQDENIIGVGQIAAGVTVTINLDVNGAISVSPVQSVWGNDQMTPVNSFYVVEGYTAQGQLAWGPNNQQIIGNGGTFDVGTWIPNTVLSWFYPALLGPTGPAGSTGPAGATGTFASGPPTPTQLLQSLPALRLWKAIPNSGSLGDNIGLSPGAVASGTSLIAATATQTNFNSYATSNSATVNNQATVCFTSLNSFAIQPNVGQIWSTQTLKAVKWQAALVDTAQVRVWIVVADAYISNIGNLVGDVPVLHLIGFRYSTAAGDTHWQAVCDNNGIQTVVDTGISPDTLGHLFGIAISPTSVTFQIDNVTVATITTNIMSNTVLFADVFSVDNISLANVKMAALAAFTSSE